MPSNSPLATLARIGLVLGPTILVVSMTRAVLNPTYSASTGALAFWLFVASASALYLDRSWEVDDAE